MEEENADHFIEGQHDAFGERMKSFEKVYEAEIPKDHAVIFRLDGVKFSTFTRKLRQPFDPAFCFAMNDTVKDIMGKMHNISTGYTHSDEITLIMPPLSPDSISNRDYNGRINKLISVISSYCSVFFNKNFRNRIEKDKKNYDEKTYQYYMDFCPVFDCRIMTFPKEKYNEVINHMIWRSIRDCKRNCASKYSYCHFKTKELHKKNTADKIAMLLEKKGLDFYKEVPLYLQHGIYTKRELVTKTGNNPVTNETVEFQRTEIISKSFKVNYDLKFLKLFFSKYWSLKNEKVENTKQEVKKEIKQEVKEETQEINKTTVDVNNETCVDNMTNENDNTIYTEWLKNIKFELFVDS